MTEIDSLTADLQDNSIPYSTDAKTLKRHSRDGSQLEIPPICIIYPQNTEQVSLAVKHCGKQGLAVTVAGGHTGLSGGILGYKAVRIETLKMGDFSIEGDSVRAQAGASIPEIIRQTAEKGFVFPVQPASACRVTDEYHYLGADIGPVTVGGSIAANASGLVGCRLGAADEWLVELTVILADGSIEKITDDFSRFAGIEGRYGIIAEALIRLAKEPEDIRSRLVRGTGYKAFSNAAAAIGRTGILPLFAEAMIMGETPPDLVLIAEKTFSDPEPFLKTYGNLFRPRSWLILLQGAQDELDVCLAALDAADTDYTAADLSAEDFTAIRQIRSAASDEIGTGIENAQKGEIEKAPVERAAMFLADAISEFRKKGMHPKAEHNLGALRIFLEQEETRSSFLSDIKKGKAFDDGSPALYERYNGDLESFLRDTLSPEVTDEMVRTKTAVNFPGNEDILIRAEQFEDTMALLDRLMKKYGACPVPLYYCHINFRKNPGWLLIHNRLLLDVREFIQ